MRILVFSVTGRLRVISIVVGRFGYKYLVVIDGQDLHVVFHCNTVEGFEFVITHDRK